MRRRLFSLCLAICMVLGMLPVMAMAAEPAKITVKAGEAEYEVSCVDTGSVYAVQIPEATAVTIGKTDAAAGDYTAANVSGGLLVSFQEYPLELTAEELSKCILTDAQKANCGDVGIDLSVGNWACIILSDGENQQYLFLLLGDANVMAIDGTEIPVADNVVDITDKEIYKLSGNYKATATNIKVTGADVVSATEDGTTVNILLSGTTAPDAEVSVEFGYTTKSVTVSGHTGTVTLENGEASLNLAITGQYSSSRKGTVNYTVNFAVDAVPTEVPTRIQQSDAKSTYTGVAVEIGLKNYFQGASNYYLVEGETLTPLEGKSYTFKTMEGGTYTLTFAAGNVVGVCPDYVTVTIEATAIESGTWIGYETSAGSLDYVLFKNANGENIEIQDISVEGTNINITLPQSFDPAGKITATFGLTQSGTYPFLSTKTATSGTSSGRADSNKFTEKTITLSNGAATFTFYYFNTAPTGSNQVTWKLNFKTFNNVPAFVDGVAGTDAKTLKAVEDTYTVDLSALYEDKDAQKLTYLVSVNDGAYIACDANYSFNTDLAGTYVLKFKASDGLDESTDIYTVTLTVENSDTTFAVPVTVAESVEGLNFYADSLSGALLTYEDGKVQVPLNVKRIWWKTDSGMTGTATVSEDTTLTLQQTTFVVKTALGAEDTAATVTVTDPEGNVVSGNGYEYLLDSGSGYTFKASPSSNVGSGWATNTAKDQTVTTELEATVEITLAVSSAKSITVDKGAELKVYYQSKYFVVSEVQPVYSTDNGDTVTYVYSCPNQTTYAMGYMYFAKKNGLIDKAGYLHSGNEFTVTWAGETRTGAYRADYDRSTTYGARGDDSVFVNINNRNHLVLNNGNTFRLRGWRIWEIIDSDTTNVMIEPEFTYTRYGSDIFTLSNVTNKASGTGGNNWVDLKATGSGVAFLEVGYEAVHIVNGYEDGSFGGAVGQSSNFTYNATDPARTALVVVQTDGNAASDITFGIMNNNGKAWDAEFDTFYFTGSSGQLTFTPSATSGIASVAVSNNKGESFTTLTADETGAYTAPIVSGSNVIRITNGNGQTAYQVVRGDVITYTITNATEGKSAGDVIIPGDTVNIAITGWHPAQSKMSGLYNASGHQLGFNYRWTDGGVADGTDGTYSMNGVVLKVTIPEDAEGPFILTGGKIAYSYFGSDPGAHRSIGDNGASQNTTAESKSALFSSLADIVIPVETGTVEAETYTVTLTEGEGYTISATEGSESPVVKGGSFSFTVSVNDGYEGTPVVMAGDTELTAVDGVYTIENITENLTVTVAGITEKQPESGVTPADVVIYTNGTDGRDWPPTPVYVDTLTLSGLAVKEYRWDGDDCYVTLLSGNAKDAAFTIACELGVENPNYMGMFSITFNGTEAESYSGTLNDGAAEIAVYAQFQSQQYSGTKTIHITTEGAEVTPNTYEVTLTECEGYTIAAVEGSESPVIEGGSFSFTVSVNDGYEGTPVVMVGDTELTAVDGVYTIENITENQTVTVAGITLKPVTYTVTLTECEGYTIAAVEGSESPVTEGGSFSFTVTVADGYEGTPVVKAGETELVAVDGIYIIENINADQTVTVSGIEKAAPVQGNLNGDATIDAADAALVYSIANGNRELTEEQLAIADVNGDGKVNAADAALIYAFANGKISSFPGR